MQQDTCTPSTDPTLKGTCMTATECAAKSGSGASADGNCASGFGVCCVFTVKCGSNANTVANNCTYIQVCEIRNSHPKSKSKPCVVKLWGIIA